MSPRTTRRQLLGGAAALGLLARIPTGWALPSGAVRTPAFIDALIARMSVEEKAGQLSLFSSAQQDGKAIVANPLQVDSTWEDGAFTLSNTYGMGAFFTQPRYAMFSVSYDY